mgnify:FL=1|jgi:Enoyl-CoA hydratase/carnithine racemase
MATEVEIERKGRLAIVTMNRPERRNALGEKGIKALLAAFAEMSRDESCGAAVLTGAPSAFCSGSDLKELGPLTVAGMCDHQAEAARLVRMLGLLPLPVVAAVEGYALGGGFVLAASCDVVVSARGARWSMPEVKNGWLPPWGLQALVARVGPVRARLVTWGITEIDGEEAHRLGIADAVVDDGKALAHAEELAQRLAVLPPNAVRSAKRYFEPFVMRDAERQDAEASRVFAQDAESAAAQATLARFIKEK